MRLLFDLDTDPQQLGKRARWWIVALVLVAVIIAEVIFALVIVAAIFAANDVRIIA